MADGGTRALAAQLPATAEAEADGLPSPQRQFAWATIIVGLTLSVLDGTIANVALPTIAHDFHAPASMSIWIVNGYQLAIVMAILPYASLGEIFGYRTIYLAGVSLFTVASLGCVLSNSLISLTLFRVLQGLGAAGPMSVNTALLRYTVPKSRFGAAIGWNALAVAAASTAGPALAGLALSVLSWPALFAINLPLGVATVAMGLFNLPESHRTAQRFDGLSALLSAVSLGLIVTTIDSIGHELPATVIVPQAAACIAGFVLLVRRERRSERPMLPLDLLRIPVFSLSVGTSIASFAAQLLAYVSLPFTFQVLDGFPPSEVGLMMIPWPLAVAVVAPISGRLSDRHSPALLGAGGLVMLSAGLVLLSVLPAEASVADISWRMALCGAGFGFFQAPNNRTLVGIAPKSRSGAASGMLGTARLMGQSIGAALVALLLARFGIPGAIVALEVGAGFALAGAIVSLLRVGRFSS